MDISKVTDLTTLKAMAYDEIAKKETAEKNLMLINQQITTVMQGIAGQLPNAPAQEQLPLGAPSASENALTDAPADAPTDEPAAPAE